MSRQASGSTRWASPSRSNAPLRLRRMATLSSRGALIGSWLWQLVSRERPEINPLKFSRTAHDSSIAKLAFSPNGSKLVSASEGRELVLWDVVGLTPVHRFEKQPDVVTGLAFEPSGNGFYVSRIDGS